MKLHYQIKGEGQPVILMHGLFGSLSNLGIIARALLAEDGYQVISVDMRNHGQSPHSDDMDYPVMATDIVALMDQLTVNNAHLLGHSMGGKAAMQVAFNFPERVKKMVVIDIAPVNYPDNRHTQIIAGLTAVDNASNSDTPITSRQQAYDLIAPHVPEEFVQHFLLKSLVRDNSKATTHLKLQFNLKSLKENYRALMDAPCLSSSPFNEHPLLSTTCGVPTLFIKGGNSNYILPEHQHSIYSLFTQATIKTIEDASHWVHAEQPEQVISSINAHLNLS